MAIDALNRNESCGGHFREDHSTPDGEAERDDVITNTSELGNIREVISTKKCCIKKN
jgi:succinate dehydrogenase/fumarate reductase flavoprotein subunit